ncbi:MAG: type II secretion system protein [Planctomycetota bacterium]
MSHSSRITHGQTRLLVRSRGLTLVELIVVLVILIALGGLIVPLFGNLGEDSREQATRATLAQVAESIIGPGGYAEVMTLARNADDDQYVGNGTGLPWPSPAEITSGRANHPQLHYLFERPTDLKDYDDSADERFYDPVLRIGWRDEWLSATTATPYEVDTVDGFTDSYGVGDGRDGSDEDDLAPIDGWGNPIVIQLPDVSLGAITDEEVENVRLVSAGPDGVIDTPDDTLTPSVAEKGDDLVLYLYREDPNP